MSEAKEPSCPPGRKPHRERIAEIVRLCPMNGKTAGVVVDNTPEHVAYYREQLAKHSEISVMFEGALTLDTYLFKITKTNQN